MARFDYKSLIIIAAGVIVAMAFIGIIAHISTRCPDGHGILAPGASQAELRKICNETRIKHH